LLGGDAGLMAGIAAVARAGAKVEIALNAGALAEAGWGLEAGGERVAAVLRDAGLAVGATRLPRRGGAPAVADDLGEAAGVGAAAVGRADRGRARPGAGDRCRGRVGARTGSGGRTR
jgi:hypothetical protein